MDNIFFDADKILKKKFNAKNGGYDAYEVDVFFDLVREDYNFFLRRESEISALLKRNDRLIAKSVDLEALNLQLTRKISELERLVQKSGTTIENLRKIDKYERQLWALGIDPSKIK